MGHDSIIMISRGGGVPGFVRNEIHLRFLVS